MMRLEEKKENMEYYGPPLSSQPHTWLNVISNNKIQLPPLPYDDQLLCLLSAPPNDPECCILFLIHESPPPDTDDDENSNDDIENKNSNDDTNDGTDTNDDDTENENFDDDDTNNDYPDDDNDDDDTDVNDDDTDNEDPDDDDDTDTNDDDTDSENLDDDDLDSNDDDTDNKNPNDDDTEDEANDDNQDDGANNDENAAALYLCKPGYDEEFHKQDLKSIIGDNCFSTRILLCLDVDDSSGTISTTPMTSQPPYNYFTEYLNMPRFGNYLIQSEDDNKVELLYVRMLFHGREFKDVYKIIVFRFDFVNKVWEEKKSIGETAIFLGPCFGGTTCCTRGTNIKRESIYFIKGRYLCIFNLETQSISVSLPCFQDKATLILVNAYGRVR
ncbi:hypothetical protein H5410_060077 [Solanum commersonii]|uniref:KIB1-4 beta-propeller domain-containing protein n=1 Tax=Solanum commersonii TaxID=4109 RepID=A0A9J5W4J8_SOLCO|nr:hypothetical protein H5410_060077 [Solanum commersonii]